MRYLKMTKNYCFRVYECFLSKEETASLCFRSVKTVTEWDKGKPIPNECKRLMRMHKCRVLCDTDEWEGFAIEGNKLKLPTGERLSAQQILIGAALIEISSELEVRCCSYLTKTARSLSRIISLNK